MIEPYIYHECSGCGVKSLRTSTYSNQQRSKEAALIQQADTDTPDTEDFNNELQELRLTTEGSDT